MQSGPGMQTYAIRNNGLSGLATKGDGNCFTAPVTTVKLLQKHTRGKASITSILTKNKSNDALTPWFIATICGNP
jgi:hypothetical protein